MICNYDFNSMRTIECDTLVIGGGVAGCSAAIASARGGAKTVLVEADGTLGGQAGVGLVTPMSSTSELNRKEMPKFGGYIEELMTEVAKLTAKYVSVNENPEDVYELSPHMTKYVLLKHAYESNVRICFHTVLCDAETKNDKIVSAILHDKSGYLRVIAKNYIDASGDADLVCLANDEYVTGSEPNVFSQLEKNNLASSHVNKEKAEVYGGEGLMQPVSLFFVMRGVDSKKAVAYENGKICFGDFGITKEKFENWEFCGTEGFVITDERVPSPQNRVLVTKGRHKDEVVVNMSRIININGADADDLSDGEIRAQLQIVAVVDFLQTFIPGFENSYLVETSARLGVRESRRLVGKYKLTGDDVINCRNFEDSICHAYFSIDIHDPRGKFGAIGGELKKTYFEVPFSALCSKKYSNFAVCGRCISCDHIAHAAARIQGCCILTGQACGTAAAVAKKNNISVCDVNFEELRAQLVADNVNLD